MNPIAKRFVAGATAEEAVSAARGLNAAGLKATLDFLGEECLTRQSAAASAGEIARLLRLMAAAKLDSNVSLKLTQLGLNLDGGLAREHLERLLDAAAESGGFVRVDMEGSTCTQRTLDLFHAVFKRRKNVGVVIQAYLRRSADDVERLIAAGARVRLCKGAYKEPPAVAFQRREEVDRSFDALARRLLEVGQLPAIATHDDARIRAAVQAARELDIPKDRFELQMLYGVRRHRWKELAGDGYAVRIYVPYGARWLPYYWRRIRERKENLLFALRSVLWD